ncbi:DMT family transporter [Candidatus Avelusimicrobium alvi]|uniref:DMT family transporter n=1 Tax=Candidatus Avelusimicrobium alvi TaxID=3416221 RepID=UPI003D1044F2
MLWKYYLFLAGAIVFEIIGTNALKAAAGFTRLGPSLLTVAAYVGAFYLLGLSLKGISLGIAYAVWAGVGIVLTALAAFLVFRERPDLPAVLGMGLIILGVVVINVFSKTVSH